jgi:hypothetical protein
MNDIPETESSATDISDDGMLETESEEAEFVLQMVDAAIRSTLDQCALSEDRKRELHSEAGRLAHGIKTFRCAPNRGAVYRLAMSALFLGLRAVLPTEEVNRLRRRVPAELGRVGGIKSGIARRESRGWTSHATELARICRARNPSAENSVIIKSILRDWGHESVAECPSLRTLQRFAKRGFGLASADKLST